MTGRLAGLGQLLRLAWRRDRVIVPASVLGLVLLSVGSAQATLALFPTDASAAEGLAGIVSNPAVVAMYGPISAASADALAVFKTVMMGAVLTSILGLVVVRRHTRTEEEEGRLELVGAGAVGRWAPLAAGLVVAVAAVVLASGLSTVGLVALGMDPTGSVAFGVAWATAGLAQVGVTALAVQLASTTRGAGGLAFGALGVFYVVRAAADSVDSGVVHALGWLSPLGWAGRVEPYGRGPPVAARPRRRRARRRHRRRARRPRPPRPRRRGPAVAARPGPRRAAAVEPAGAGLAPGDGHGRRLGRRPRRGRGGARVAPRRGRRPHGQPRDAEVPRAARRVGGHRRGHLPRDRDQVRRGGRHRGRRRPRPAPRRGGALRPRRDRARRPDEPDVAGTSRTSPWPSPRRPASCSSSGSPSASSGRAPVPRPPASARSSGPSSPPCRRSGCSSGSRRCSWAPGRGSPPWPGRPSSSASSSASSARRCSCPAGSSTSRPSRTCRSCRAGRSRPSRPVTMTLLAAALAGAGALAYTRRDAV